MLCCLQSCKILKATSSVCTQVMLNKEKYNLSRHSRGRKAKPVALQQLFRVAVFSSGPVHGLGTATHALLFAVRFHSVDDESAESALRRGTYESTMAVSLGMKDAAR